MKPLEAIDEILMAQQLRWPISTSKEGDRALPLNVALAQLSGALEACEDAEQLLKAAWDGLHLVMNRRVSVTEWRDASNEIEAELSAWASQRDSVSAEAGELIRQHAAEPVPARKRRAGRVYGKRREEWNESE